MDFFKVKEYLNNINVEYKTEYNDNDIIITTKIRLKHTEIDSLKKRIIVYVPKPKIKQKKVNKSFIYGFTGCAITGHQFKFYYKSK